MLSFTAFQLFTSIHTHFFLCCLKNTFTVCLRRSKRMGGGKGDGRLTYNASSCKLYSSILDIRLNIQ